MTAQLYQADGDKIQADAQKLFLSLCTATPKSFLDEIPRTMQQYAVEVRADLLEGKWEEAVRELVRVVNESGAEYLDWFDRSDLPGAVHFAGGRYLRLIVQYLPPVVDENGCLVPEMWIGRFDVRTLTRAL